MKLNINVIRLLHLLHSVAYSVYLDSKRVSVLLKVLLPSLPMLYLPLKYLGLNEFSFLTHDNMNCLTNEFVTYILSLSRGTNATRSKEGLSVTMSC